MKKMLLRSLLYQHSQQPSPDGAHLGAAGRPPPSQEQPRAMGSSWDHPSLSGHGG